MAVIGFIVSLPPMSRLKGRKSSPANRSEDEISLDQVERIAQYVPSDFM